MSVNKSDYMLTHLMGLTFFPGCGRRGCGKLRSDGFTRRYCSACRMRWLYPEPFERALMELARSIRKAWH